MDEIIASKDETFLFNSESISVKPLTKYKITSTITADYGELYSAYFTVMILDAVNKEIVRHIRWIRNFSGVQQNYSIVFATPSESKNVSVGLRVNVETPIKSNIKIKSHNLVTLKLCEVPEQEIEQFDDIQEYAKKFAGYKAQSYETVWDSYSQLFDSGNASQDINHLGDEWGVKEKTDNIFKTYVLPYLKTASTIAEIGVGGGKYSILVAPYVNTLYGIDISKEMLARTERRLKDSRCKFIPVKTNGATIELPDGSIDFIFSIDSCVHIFPYELYSYTQEIARILKREAIGVIEFADWNLPESFAKFSFDHAIFRSTGEMNPGAFGFIDRGVMSNFMSAAKLKVLKFDIVTPRTSLVIFQK